MCHITKIQRLQNRIARIVANNYDYDISPSVILCELGIMNILQRRDYFMSTLMYRCINGSAPTYLTDRIDYVSTYNTYCTRTSNQLMFHVPKPRIEKFRESFQYAGLHLYNSIPKEITASTSLITFKSKMKEHIY